MEGEGRGRVGERPEAGRIGPGAPVPADRPRGDAPRDLDPDPGPVGPQLTDDAPDLRGTGVVDQQGTGPGPERLGRLGPGPDLDLDPFVPGGPPSGPGDRLGERKERQVVVLDQHRIGKVPAVRPSPTVDHRGLLEVPEPRQGLAGGPDLGAGALPAAPGGADRPGGGGGHPARVHEEVEDRPLDRQHRAAVAMEEQDRHPRPDPGPVGGRPDHLQPRPPGGHPGGRDAGQHARRLGPDPALRREGRREQPGGRPIAPPSVFFEGAFDHLVEPGDPEPGRWTAAHAFGAGGLLRNGSRTTRAGTDRPRSSRLSSVPGSASARGR